MKTALHNSAAGLSRRRAWHRAYLMVEALVYIGVLFVVLTGGYLALYRSAENATLLRRSADDVSNLLHAGERWRADIRAATVVRVEKEGSGQLILLENAQYAISYRFSSNTLFRRVDTHAWSTVLTRVKDSAMQPDPRRHVTAWRWDIELQSRAKSPRTRPLFTFLAVPKSSPAK